MIREVASHVYERRVKPEGVAWFINTFLIRLDQANIYIDSGLGSQAILDLQTFADPTKPNVLVYTHYHFDHVWGSGAIPFAKIIACDPFNELLQEDFDLSYAYYKEIQEGKVECVYADTLIQYKTQLGPLTLIPSPGHTKDGLCIYDSITGLIIMGDNLPDQGKGPLPEIDDLEAYLKTLETLKDLNAKMLLGSHCDEVKAEQLEAMLKSLTYPEKV